MYLNVGGIKSRGIAAALSWRATRGLSLPGSYTLNHATYIGTGTGTGNAAQDADIGIRPGRPPSSSETDSSAATAPRPRRASP